MGPFLDTGHIGEVAYHLNLKDQFTYVHPVFHVSLLRRFVEGHHGMLFTTNCLLVIGKNLSKLFGFVYLCLGRVREGFSAGA